MNHTKEPWKVFEWDDRQSAIHFMSVVSKLTGEMVASYLPIADAQRIVACVNACAGITNEALEKGIVLSSVEKECWKWMHDNNLRYKDGSDRDFEWHGVKVWEKDV